MKSWSFIHLFNNTYDNYEGIPELDIKTHKHDCVMVFDYAKRLTRTERAKRKYGQYRHIK